MTYDQTRRLPVPLTTSSTNSNGTAISTAVTISRTFDDFVHFTSTDPNNIQTTYAYDTATHLLSSVSHPLNANLTAYVQYARNSAGSLTQIVVKDNNASGSLRAQTNIAYDSYGNPVTVTVKDDGRNTITNQEYSPDSGNAFLTKRTANVTDADGVVSTVTEQMQYDKTTGNLKVYTDGKTKMTSYEYDKLDRVTKATFPDNSIITIAFDDTNNKITSVDQTGITTVTQWNGLGWKISEGVIGGGIFTYGYDIFGRMSWSKDATAMGNKTSYLYDAWNRLTTTTYPDNAAAVVTFDDVNQMVTTSDAESNSYRQTYDKLGRTINDEWLKSTGNITLGSYTYDYVGNTITSTDGNTNTTTYRYDVLNRLISVTDPETRTTASDAAALDN